MFVCLLLLFLLVAVHHQSQAETDVSCPSALTDCACYQNDANLLRVKCEATLFKTVKSALVEDSLHTDVYKLQLLSTDDTTLQKGYLDDFTSLTDLELTYGDLSYIEPGAFKEASSLQNLDLSHNEFTWLYGGMFEGLTTSMETMELANNDLEYLYSDMEDVFLKVSEDINLSGNSINCSCEIQWLIDLFDSDETLPDFSGAKCTDTGGTTYALNSNSPLQFTDCADICTGGYHNCEVNKMCLLDVNTKSFLCSNGSGQSSSSTGSPSSTTSSIAVISSIELTPSPSPSIEDDMIFSSTVSLVISSSEEYPFVSSLSLYDYTDVIHSPSPSVLDGFVTISSALYSSFVEDYKSYISQVSSLEVPLTTINSVGPSQTTDHTAIDISITKTSAPGVSSTTETRREVITTSTGTSTVTSTGTSTVTLTTMFSATSTATSIATSTTTSTATSTVTSTVTSTISETLSSSSYDLFTLPPSPTPTSDPVEIVPVECDGSTTCEASTESCSLACQCPFCSCNDGLSWESNGNTCIAPSSDQAVCKNDNLLGLTWPLVVGGATVSIPCCSISGDSCSTMATRTCTLEGEWSNSIVDNCLSLSVYQLQQMFNNVINGVGGAIQNLSSTIAQESNNQDLMIEDLVYLSNLISDTVENAIDSDTDPQVISDIVNSVSNLLDDKHVDTWQNEETSGAIITQLFNAVETLGTLIPVTNGTVTIVTDNLVLQVITPDGTEKGWNISSSLLNGTTLEGQSSIYLPGSVLMDALGGQNLTGCNVRVIASLWDVSPSLFNVNSTSLMEEEPPLVHGICRWNDGASSDSSVLFINSVVISASLYSSNCTLNTSNLSKPVQIILHHINQTLDDPTCSFLDPMDNSGSDWSSNGCRVSESSESDQTICECFHLTSFALLMSPTGSVTVSQPLIIATKVGLSVSILALLATIILLFALKLEGELNKVHRQLAIALCLSQFVFLVGVDRVSIPYPDAACTAIAALLHYLLLCTFAWELVEGIHLYLFIVKVFYNKKVMWSYYPLAWGIPVIIVGVTLGLNFCEYGSENYCWITTGQGTTWAFHGPVAAVIVINIIMLVIITGVVIRSVRRKDPDSCGFCKLLQASFILVPTLGLTWVLGFLVVGNDDFALVIEWIFFVLTTLQGLLIFTIHCVLNTEVRASFLKALGFREAAKKQKSVFSFNPGAAINSGLRRLSGTASRRGSLEPLASEDGKRTGRLPTPQDIKRLQAKFGGALQQLATVNEEEDESIAEIETDINEPRALDEEQQKDVVDREDDSDDMVVGSTIELLTADQYSRRRSSTDGLLDEPKQGLYQFDSYSSAEAIDAGRTENNSLNEDEMEPEVVIAAGKEEKIELVGFSLGINNVPLTVSLSLEETLKARSLSCIEEGRKQSIESTTTRPIVRYNSETNHANSTATTECAVDDDDRSLINKSTSTLSSTSVNNELNVNRTSCDNGMLVSGRSMEQLLLNHNGQAASNGDISWLEGELSESNSQANLLY